MRLNSDRAIELGRQLFAKYGNWEAVRAAGVERPDGVIDLTGIGLGLDAQAVALLAALKAARCVIDTDACPDAYRIVDDAIAKADGAS